MENFFVLNNLLLLSGCKSGANRIINFNIKLFYMVAVIIPRIIFVFSEEEKEIGILLPTYFLLTYLFLALSLVDLELKLNEINGCIRGVLGLLAKNNVKRLMLKTKLLSATFILIFVLYEALFVIDQLDRFPDYLEEYFLWKPKNVQIYHKFMVIIYGFFQKFIFNGLFFLHVIFYLVFLFTYEELALKQQEMASQLDEAISRLIDEDGVLHYNKVIPDQIVTLRATRRLGLGLRKAGNDAFCLTPFLIVTNFSAEATIKISHMILHGVSSTDGLSEKVAVFVEPMNIVLSLISTVAVITYGGRVSHQFEQVDRLAFKLTQPYPQPLGSELESELLKLQIDLATDPGTYTYVWKALTLDKNLLLAIGGHCITIVIMILSTVSNQKSPLKNVTECCRKMSLVMNKTAKS